MTLKTIHIALPSHSGQVCAQTFQWLTQEMIICASKGYDLRIDQLIGSSDIQAIRNSYIARFMHAKDKAHRLIYVDADLECEMGTLVRLIEHDVDFVVGGYRVKAEPEQYRVHFLPGPILKKNPRTGTIANDDDPKGLVEINRAPGGLVCISQYVARKLSDAYSDLTYNDGDSPSGQSVGLFDCLYSSGNRWSEDLSFCMRWRDLGEKIWLDPNISISHWGIKGYSGNMETYLRQRAIREKIAA